MLLHFFFEPEKICHEGLRIRAFFTVHIKELFQIIFFVTYGSLKDLLSILTNLINIKNPSNTNRFVVNEL